VGTFTQRPAVRHSTVIQSLFDEPRAEYRIRYPVYSRSDGRYDNSYMAATTLRDAELVAVAQSRSHGHAVISNMLTGEHVGDYIDGRRI